MCWKEQVGQSEGFWVGCGGFVLCYIIKQYRPYGQLSSFQLEKDWPLKAYLRIEMSGSMSWVCWGPEVHRRYLMKT